MMRFSKKVLSVVLCLVMLFGTVAVGGEGFSEAFSPLMDSISINAFAENETEGQCGPSLNWKYDEESHTLTINGSGPMSDYDHNNQGGGVTITTAPWRDFAIENVLISDGVTSIGNSAFYHKGIEHVDMANSVDSIGSFAFTFCSSLETINISTSVTIIGSSAFEYCNNLRSITIPSVTGSSLEDVFKHCSRLESITVLTGNRRYYSSGNCLINKESKTIILGCKNSIIPLDDSVTTIGELAFAECEGLTSLDIPNNITRLEWGAFWGCSNLTNMTFSEKVVHISHDVFNGTPFYDEENWDADGALYIGNYFIKLKNNNLTEYTIKEGTTCVASEAFINKKELTNIDIPDSLIAISDTAFLGCSGLINLTIPKNVKRIGGDAFIGCNSIESIVYNAIDCSDFSSGSFYSCEVKNVTIGSEVKVIPSYFLDCKDINNIVIPDGVESIGNRAFYGCPITRIIIPDSVIDCGDAFRGCPLEYVKIGDGLTYIPSNIVNSKCLKTFIIGNNVTSIEKETFKECEGITSIIIPNSVTNIGDSAFYKCSNLRSVSLGEGLKTIEKYAFAGCNSLSNISFPEGLKTIESSAFSGCKKFTKIDIPSSVEYIAASSFSGCTSIESITAPEGKDRYYCSGNCLVIVDQWKRQTLVLGTSNSTIPYGVNSIGGSAFSEKKQLTSINIPDSVTSLDGFSRTGLTSVFIPKNVQSISSTAFSYCSNLASITVSDENSRFTTSTKYISQNGTIIHEWKCLMSNGSIIRGCKNSIIPDEEFITTIGDYSFSGCKGLTKLIIPNNIQKIGRYAFDECFDLRMLTIPESVTSIGYGAFDGCQNLRIYYSGSEENWESIYKGDLPFSVVVYYNSNGNDYYDDPPEDFVEYEYDIRVGFAEDWVIDTDPVKSISKLKLNGEWFDLSLEGCMGYSRSKGKISIDSGVGVERLSEVTDYELIYIVENNQITYIIPKMFVADQTVEIISDLLFYSGGEYDDNKVAVYFDIHNNISLGNDYYYSMFYSRVSPETKYNSYQLGKAIYDYIKDSENNFKVIDCEFQVSDSSLLNFEGEDSLVFIPLNSIGISWGETYSDEIEVYVNTDNKLGDKNYIDCKISVKVNGILNGRELSVEDSCYCRVRNLDIPNTEPDPLSLFVDDLTVPDFNNDIKIVSDYLNSSAVTLDGDITQTLYDLMSDDTLIGIGEALMCQVIIAEAPNPKETFGDKVNKKVIGEAFKLINYSKPRFALIDGHLSSYFLVNTKYGELEIKFTVKFGKPSLDDQSYGFWGEINYEIVGGNGFNSLPEKIHLSGLAGVMSGANINSFYNSLYNIVKSELKNAYDIGYGKTANEAVDIIFGTSVNKALSYTKYKSTSGAYWALLTSSVKSETINCPVDVYVYDSTNTVVAIIENNQVILSSENVSAFVENGAKYLFLYDNNYTVNYIATADGSMTVSVKEYGTTDVLLNTSIIENVPIEAGEVLTQNVDEYLANDSNYDIQSCTSGVVYKSSHKENNLHTHISDGKIEREVSPCCITCGHYLSRCSICSNWFVVSVPELGHRFTNYNYNNDATTDNDGTETAKCDICDETDTRIKPGTKIIPDQPTNPTASAKLKVPSNTEVEYSATVTVKAKATDVPEGYYVALYDGKTLLKKGSNTEASYTFPGEFKETKNITVKIIDADENVQKDADGKELTGTVEIKAKSGFFDKLIAFFKRLFKALPSVTVEPK